MAIYDSVRGGYRIFVGDLGPCVGKVELQREFESFGPVIDVWVARLQTSLLLVASSIYYTVMLKSVMNALKQN